RIYRHEISTYPLTYPNNAPLCHLFRVEIIIFAAMSAETIAPAATETSVLADRHMCFARQTQVSDKQYIIG
ncbi:MAG: hypothetical protein IKS70_05700, partial [Bacteroides sp.]|nr:hypothetical protein [Bacteroides sp.]